MSILVLGDQALDPTLHGRGSGQVISNFIYTPLQALAEELGVPFMNDSQWTSCDYPQKICLTYCGADSTNDKGKSSSEACNKYILENSFNTTIIFQGQDSGEGSDRKTYGWNQSVFDTLKKVANPGKVIGCMVSPGPILTNNMRKYADAILFNVYPGQQYARGLMNIIFGRVNPSAKLSFTMPNIDNEQHMSVAQYPGTDDGKNSSYSEKHHFGYRWYDQYNFTPAFEFGHGLSYSTFELKDLGHKALGDNQFKFHCRLNNTGSMKGSQVLQLYVGYPETENVNGGYRSPKVLRKFNFVRDLAPGNSALSEFVLDKSDFRYWSVEDAAWKVDAGEYEIFVGFSSRDIIYSQKIRVE